MKDNNFKDISSSYSEETKDTFSSHINSKYDYDLYHEEDDKQEPMIRVKRFNMPNKGEKWKVFNDNKVIFSIESPKLSKKEREFLQSIAGFNFILNQAKAGIKSLNNFKLELKKIIPAGSRKKKKKSSRAKVLTKK